MTTLDREERFLAAFSLDLITLVSFMFHGTPLIGEPIAVFVSAPLFAVSIMYGASLFWDGKVTFGAAQAERITRATIGRVRSMSIGPWKLVALVATAAIIGWVAASIVASLAWIPVATAAYAIAERETIADMVTSR